MSHSFIFLISNTSRPSLHISHSPICEFYPLWVCHKGTSVLIPPLPPDYWHTSFIFLAGPGPLHEIAVSAFSRSPLGRANTFSFLFLLLTPRKSLKCCSSFTLFLSASVSNMYMLSFSSVLYPANFSMDIISSWFLPISFQTFSTTLSHLYSISPFCYFLSYSPISYGWQPLFWQLSHVSICLQVGTFPVLLLILYYSSYLSILVLC